MRNAVISTIFEIAKENSNLFLITGDLGYGVLTSFWEEFPSRFINAGICEQNMTSIAAGIALEGKIVFTYSIANFPTLRCLEQIRNDCAYHNANVKIIAVGGGFAYGSLGMSHHATEDIAVIRSLPEVTILAPGDLEEAECAVRAIYQHNGTCYLRLGKGGEKRIHPPILNFKIGKAIKILEGDDIAILTSGTILEEGLDAAKLLKDSGINSAVYSFPTVKPLDEDIIKKLSQKVKLVVTVEEHNILGGFGGAVAEVMAEMESKKACLMRIGLNDTYTSIVGSQKYLREQYGLSSDQIFDTISTKYRRMI